jgi:hypothetical protein
MDSSPRYSCKQFKFQYGPSRRLKVVIRATKLPTTADHKDGTAGPLSPVLGTATKLPTSTTGRWGVPRTCERTPLLGHRRYAAARRQEPSKDVGRSPDAHLPKSDERGIINLSGEQTPSCGRGTYAVNRGMQKRHGPVNARQQPISPAGQQAQPQKGQPARILENKRVLVVNRLYKTRVNRIQSAAIGVELSLLLGLLPKIYLGGSEAPTAGTLNGNECVRALATVTSTAMCLSCGAAKFN